VRFESVGDVKFGREAADDNFVTFNLRKMERREQHRFRRELVKAFREAGLQQARAA
jgi:hypothetical protein